MKLFDGRSKSWHSLTCQSLITFRGDKHIGVFVEDIHLIYCLQRSQHSDELLGVLEVNIVWIKRIEHNLMNCKVFSSLENIRVQLVSIHKQPEWYLEYWLRYWSSTWCGRVVPGSSLQTSSQLHYWNITQDTDYKELVFLVYIISQFLQEMINPNAIFGYCWLDFEGFKGWDIVLEMFWLVTLYPYHVQNFGLVLTRTAGLLVLVTKLQLH